MKMIGTGKDPLGRYPEGLIFDLEDNDHEMIEDFKSKGWATECPPEEHPGRTKTQIAAAMVRGDALADPVEQKIAEEIGENAHAVVHLDDPDATVADYDSEVEESRSKQVEHKSQVATDSLGGVPAKGKSKAPATSSSGSSSSGSSSGSSA